MKLRPESSLLLAFAALVYACGGSDRPVDAPLAPTAEARVIGGEAPEPDGEVWETLFDGESLESWHAYGGDDVGEAWKIAEDGSFFYLDATDKVDGRITAGGDIVTDEPFDNYELELEWKISECGNSGLIYNVTEAPDHDYAWRTGPEMQILDDSCHPDAKIVKHRAGDLYDVVESAAPAAKPAGEWNAVRLVVTDDRVEQYLNGERVVAYAPRGASWEALVAESKFAEFPAFGKTTGGQIALQDHGDEVYFRNVRIREIAE